MASSSLRTVASRVRRTEISPSSWEMSVESDAISSVRTPFSWRCSSISRFLLVHLALEVLGAGERRAPDGEREHGEGGECQSDS